MLSTHCGHWRCNHPETDQCQEPSIAAFVRAVMGDYAARFRERAKQCRDLAKDARDEEARRTLKEMAEELDEEADRIDAEEATGPEIVLEPKPEG